MTENKRTTQDIIREWTDKFNWPKWAAVSQVTGVLVAFLMVVLAFVNISLVKSGYRIQLKSIKNENKALALQLKQLQLDKRPYLSIDITPRLWTNGENYFFGGNLFFRNEGSFPASDITPEYLVSNDIDNENVDFKKWHNDTYGAFPDVKIVPPKDRIGPIPYAPGLPKDATFACVGILVSYTGFESGKRYWFKRVDSYRILKDENGNPSQLILIDPAVDWDKEANFDIPKLNIPIWSKFEK